MSTTFADLGLHVGDSINVELSPHALKFHLKLLGYIDGVSLMVSAPRREGKELLLDKGDQLAVRMLVKKQIVAFETRVIYRSLQPVTYYHLQYPSEIESVQIRDSERIDTLLAAEFDSEFDILDDWPRAGAVTNLSQSGAAVQSHDSLGEEGHEIIISFPLKVAGVEKIIRTQGIIRKVERLEFDDGSSEYSYGIQFVNLHEDYRLIIGSYIYERESGRSS